MPIIDLHKPYWWASEELTGRDNGLMLKMSFHDNLKIRKSSMTFDCRVCKKKRGKGFRYIGTQWDKICFYCLDEWCKNSQETIKEMKNTITNIGNTLEENREKWKKEALIGALNTN